MNLYFRNRWMEFTPEWGFYFMLRTIGYEDNRPLLICWASSVFLLITIPLTFIFPSWWWIPVIILQTISGWGQLYLHIPIRRNKNRNTLWDPDSPSYGIYMLDRSLWISFGKKTKRIGLPHTYDWHRTSHLLKDGTWCHETSNSRKLKRGLNYLEHARKLQNYIEENKWCEAHPYTYILRSGEIQERKAMISVEEREWRMNGLKWTSLFAMIRKTIHVDFNEEVGERTGSWKGGTTGCGYDIRPDETPLQTLRRMEIERKFT